MYMIPPFHAHITAYHMRRVEVIDYNLRELVEVVSNQVAMMASGLSCPKFDQYVAEIRALSEERAELVVYYFPKIQPLDFGK